jgi:hypothetical protein
MLSSYSSSEYYLEDLTYEENRKKRTGNYFFPDYRNPT